MRIDPSAGSTGLDARDLDGLRAQAAKDPKAAARQTSVQFESLFMQMVVKSMRDRKRPVEYMVAMGEGHSVARRETKVELATRLIRFLDEHAAAR